MFEVGRTLFPFSRVHAQSGHHREAIASIDRALDIFTQLNAIPMIEQAQLLRKTFGSVAG